ncbi:MAG: sugar phosphate isomerase/epimerase family protein [Adhaeribacter sp.]
MSQPSLPAFLSFILGLLVSSCTVSSKPQQVPQPLQVGYNLGVKNITPEKMAYAKSVGIDYVETSFSAYVDKDRHFLASDEAILEQVKKAKAAADQAGIVIWSIHMPFGKDIDISLADEAERQQVVALHQKILTFARVLQPRIILFHPSYFLGLNERELRKSQMIKSSIELQQAVKAIKADMVIENMLGPALLVGAKQERPLCRTVEETVEIMNRLPRDIYSAIDMNHIKNPENLIRAMGTRLKSVHIADGHGEKEDHYFPCSEEGSNNWVEILAALEEARYRGPFMFESAHKDVKDLKPCYQTLYQQYLQAKYNQPAALNK